MDDFTSTDVLSRAAEMLRDGPLPEEDREHGMWCPYCAISLAKGQLDREHGTGVDMTTALFETYNNMVMEHAEDMPLVEARKRLGVIELPATRETAVAAIEKALAEGGTG